MCFQIVDFLPPLKRLGCARYQFNTSVSEIQNYAYLGRRTKEIYSTGRQPKSSLAERKEDGAQELSIEVSNLRREFDSKEGRAVALDGVTLQVKRGEVFGVLGPNGAGKTTLIRILSTLLLPSGGTARVWGYDVAREPERVRRVINLASGAERAGYDFISARRNLWFFSQLYGLPSDLAHKRINELSEMLGLTKYLDRKFYALSTGYRQRATIARAFINDPKVVFLDEPTIGLDVMTALTIREFLLKQARENGRTVVLASHNMAEVDAICDRVAIIDKGRILAIDSPSALKKSLGAPSLVLEVTPPPSGLEGILLIPGVRGATSSVDIERGVARLQVVVDGEDHVSKILEAVEVSGHKVLSSWRQPPTLEEVFVALVGTGFREREEAFGP
jgi:ABC-2 type transport system ATP-binding protein